MEKLFKIFVIEDNELYGELIKFYLEQDKRYKVETFSSAEDCLFHLNEKPNLIISDLYLNTGNPKAMSGADLIKYFKDNNIEVPIVILSCQDQIRIAGDLLKDGASDYLIKDENTFPNLEKVVSYCVDKNC